MFGFLHLLWIMIFLIKAFLFAQGYVCAIGGGSENYNDWSDAPYKWIVQKADSGKIIIIDVADASSWLPNYFMSLGADTAYNKTISSTYVANLQSTYDELTSANAIFIRGGNQWDYIRLWKGTKVDSAIQFVFNNGGVIAGTSAGAAILGDVDFSAQNGSAYPNEALQNPFYSKMKFENNFIKLVPNVLFDTHFIERGRHGRLIAMIYNLFFSTGTDLIGVGIDDRTAICIFPDGTGEVLGSGAVTIFYKDSLTKFSPYISGKYTIENLKSHVLTKGWKFNFNIKEITFIPGSAKNFDSTKTILLPITDFYLTSSNEISSNLNHLSNFLTHYNSSNILVISYPGFSNALSALINFLNNNGYNFSVLNLTSSNLNDQNEANKIGNATCFVFVGDSLEVLSLLNQTGNLLPDIFNNSIQSGKPIFFFGNAGKISGEKYVGNTDTDPYASYRGKMTLNNGLNLFRDLIFQPLLFANSSYYENRMSSVLWGMMRERKKIGIYVDGNDRIKISSNDNSISGNTSKPFLIIDAREAEKVDSSTYRASGSTGPRQVVAFDHLRWSLSNYSDIKYLLQEGKFDYLTELEDEISSAQPNDFILYQNYPNPFNPLTKIKFVIPNVGIEPALSTLKIYNLLGQEIATLLNEHKPAGNYEIEFDGSELPSGIYFYRLTIGNFSKTKAMMLLK